MYSEVQLQFLVFDFQLLKVSSATALCTSRLHNICSYGRTAENMQTYSVNDCRMLKSILECNMFFGLCQSLSYLGMKATSLFFSYTKSFFLDI